MESQRLSTHRRAKPEKLTNEIICLKYNQQMNKYSMNQSITNERIFPIHFLFKSRQRL